MLVLISFFLALIPDVRACSTFALGRKATVDGSVIIGQSEDGDDTADSRLIYVPAADHPPGAQRPVFYTDGPFPRWTTDTEGPGYRPNKETGPKLSTPIGFIPQVNHTFGYQSANYAVINEHNVAIDESTCSAVFHTCARGDSRGCGPGQTPNRTGAAILDSRMLSFIGLERATTAREAVQIMGALAYEYGFYGTHDQNGHGEALMVADPNEAWVFNILADPTGTKAIWAAIRVPDGHVTVLANMFTLREIDVTDTENCLASPNIYSVAEDRGWWRPGQPFDFTRIYSNGEYSNKYYSGRRMWRGLMLAAPSLNLSPEYSDLRYDRAWPWSVKPDKLITLDDVKSWYRDWFAGTEFDLTKGLAAGFGGTPDRFETGSAVKGAWERSFALYRTGVVKIQHLQHAAPGRPQGVAGVAWVAGGPAHYAPFVPIPSGVDRSLEPLYHDPAWAYSKKSMNWAARKVMMVSQIRFDHMHKLVQAKQNEVEAVGHALLDSMVNDFARTGDTKALSHTVEKHCDDVFHTWRDLPDEMLYHFSDNSNMFKIAPGDTSKLDYPAWWLKAVGFEKGPPPPPVEAQCPPRCPGLRLDDMEEDNPTYRFGYSPLFVGAAAAVVTMIVGLAPALSHVFHTWRRHHPPGGAQDCATPYGRF